MNWLAHFYLSEPDAAFRIGNVLPDMLRLADLEAMPAIYQGGIARHRAIDSSPIHTPSCGAAYRDSARASGDSRAYSPMCSTTIF